MKLTHHDVSLIYLHSFPTLILLTSPALFLSPQPIQFFIIMTGRTKSPGTSGPEKEKRKAIDLELKMKVIVQNENGESVSTVPHDKLVTFHHISHSEG